MKFVRKIKQIKFDKYLITSLLLTLFFISSIFFINNIYPFGTDVFNSYDFDHAYVPVYYKLWDLLHGKGSMLFDWNLGAGLNCFGSLVSNSLLSPTSLIIGLFPRSYIPYAMSFILAIKLLIVTLFTYITISKLFPRVDGFFKVIFSLSYTFCGWTVFMISSLLYLDVFALFPLFVLAYYRLMKDKKWLMYVVVLTYCLLLNYYMSWMILFFIIGVTIISLLTLDIKEKKKKAVMVLLLTLISLGLSCFLFLPAFTQARESYRMNSVNTSYEFNLGEMFLKLVYMFPMAISFYFTVKQLFIKKDKRVNLFIILMMIYLLIGIFVPQINVMWHTGSYSGLPFRYSYIPSFMLILFALYYLQNNFDGNKKNGNVVYFFLSILMIVLIIVLAYLYKNEYNDVFLYQISKYSQFFALLMINAVTFVSMFVFSKNNVRIYKFLILILLFIQTNYYFYYFLHNENIDNSTSLYTQEISGSFSLLRDGYNYVDNTISLNYNFPYILNVPSMTNRLHFIKEEEVNFSKNFGYSGIDTFILSKSGNLFSNLLMQNKYYFSNIKMDERLYDLVEERNGIYLYESKYNLNYLIPYDGKVINEFSDSIIENTNLIYCSLFNKDSDIINYIENGVITLSHDNIYYFYSDNYLYDLLYQIESLDDNSYILFDSSYDNVVHEVIVSHDIEVDLSNYDVDVGYINVDDYIEFVNGINDYDVSIETEGNKRTYYYNSSSDISVLIPVNYDESFVIKVNGEMVDYELNVYNMISINIKHGDNKIELIYVPKNLKKGIIISVISLLFLIIFSFLNIKFNLLDKKFILYPLFVITSLIGILFILKIYIFFWV